MSITRWKAQSLQLHRFLTGPQSKAAKHGVLPLFAHLAFTIACCGGAIAGMAKKAWRDDNPGALPLQNIRAMRRQIEAAFDQLENSLEKQAEKAASALSPETLPAAEAAYQAHGNLAILSLALMEEAAEFAEPLMKVASGQKTLQEAKQNLEEESADLRIYLHIASDRAGICPESSTTAKWSRVQDRYPPEAFSPGPRVISKTKQTSQMPLPLSSHDNTTIQ